MKLFRIVKETHLWREKYVVSYFVEEKVYLLGIPLFWYRHIEEDMGSLSRYKYFDTEEQAMQYITKYLEYLNQKTKKKKKFTKEVIKVINVDKALI